MGGYFSPSFEFQAWEGAWEAAERTMREEVGAGPVRHIL